MPKTKSERLASRASVSTGIENTPARLKEIHDEIIRLRNNAANQAAFATKLAIEAGEILFEAKKRHKGEFTLWVETHCEFSYDTADRYIKVALHSAALRSGELDGKTLKEVYVAIGLLPQGEPKPSDSNTDPYHSFWSQTEKIFNWVPKLKEDRDRERLVEWALNLLKQLGHQV